MQWIAMNEMDGPMTYVVLLQNTVPLRKSWHVDEAY